MGWLYRSRQEACALAADVMYACLGDAGSVTEDYLAYVSVVRTPTAVERHLRAVVALAACVCSFMLVEDTCRGYKKIEQEATRKARNLNVEPFWDLIASAVNERAAREDDVCSLF